MKNTGPRSVDADFVIRIRKLDLWGTVGTDWGRLGAVAPRRRGRFWVLGGEERGSWRRGRERQNQPFNKPSTTLSDKEDIQSSHLYRETAFTHSHPASNNTINNNQAIPLGIRIISTTIYCGDFRSPQSSVVIETAAQE